MKRFAGNEKLHVGEVKHVQGKEGDCDQHNTKRDKAYASAYNALHCAQRMVGCLIHAPFFIDSVFVFSELGCGRCGSFGWHTPVLRRFSTGSDKANNKNGAVVDSFKGLA